MAKTRANNEGNIKLRADGRYEVRVTVDYDKMTGKPKRVSKYAKTREEAVKLLNQMSFMNDTSPNNFTRVTLGDWLDLCLEVYMKNTIKQSTYLSYESYIRVHLKPALGDVVLQELTPRMLQLFYNYKAESEGLSAKTIVNLNLFLHRALKFAVAEGYINSNPASSVNLPSGGRPQITILTRDEQMDERIVMSENEKGETEARIVVGNARIIRNALPNATFIGFTGTPVSSKDRNTREVFGDYIDIYDMTQAVEDGATRPVYYESRVIHLKLDENTLALIDSTYDILEQQASAETIAKSKKMLGQMESVLGADSTIASLVDDIVTHYETNRANLLTGKAMIVAYSRPIAMKIYRRILEIRPSWKEKVGVVMTGGNNDPEDWKEIIGTKSHKEELARKFKDNNDPMKIAIVVDMWLTGFDVPSLATMYVYKPMHGYNLMQAIARVNRVFKDKEGGLVVDYVGIAGALKAAMNEYTARDRSKYGDMDISKTAYPKFQEKLQVCRDLFHGFDYSGFIAGSPLTMAKLIADGANFVLDPKSQERKDLFLKEALLTKQAMSLCSSMTTEKERHEAAYFEAVRSTVIKLTYGGNGGKVLSLPEINAQINELLKASIQSEGVISLFDSRKAGENFSLFDPAVLDEISHMKQKNIAVEILKKLLAEQVSIYKRTNVVQSAKFSEMITRIMNAYYNGHISNDEVIKELLEAAEMIAKAHQAGDALGLTQEELAFYDALTKPQAIKDFYENDVLVQMTRELTEMLRKNRTIDWQKKETARATMRKMVKRLLKKYKYPPEQCEDAINTVISQCEMWTDNAELS